ncbi:MAG: hypothetical protein AB2448_01495 [Moorella sp. (in: firmicutes)]
MQTTPNYGLKKPEANDTVNIADLNANADTLDSALTPTADPTQVPTGNGPGKLVQWVGWLANRIKAITGKTNWYDAPDITLATLAAHKTRHATGGADALAPGDIGAASAADLAAHLADYANPHRVKAEQVFSIGGIPSGTAFPTTPANYTLFYRTDLKKLFIYLP